MGDPTPVGHGGESNEQHMGEPGKSRAVVDLPVVRRPLPLDPEGSMGRVSLHRSTSGSNVEPPSLTGNTNPIHMKATRRSCGRRQVAGELGRIKACLT